MSGFARWLTARSSQHKTSAKTINFFKGLKWHLIYLLANANANWHQEAEGREYKSQAATKATSKCVLDLYEWLNLEMPSEIRYFSPISGELTPQRLLCFSHLGSVNQRGVQRYTTASFPGMPVETTEHQMWFADAFRVPACWAFSPYIPLSAAKMLFISLRLIGSLIALKSAQKLVRACVFSCMQIKTRDNERGEREQERVGKWMGERGVC